MGGLDGGLDGGRHSGLHGQLQGAVPTLGLEVVTCLRSAAMYCTGSNRATAAVAITSGAFAAAGAAAVIAACRVARRGRHCCQALSQRATTAHVVAIGARSVVAAKGSQSIGGAKAEANIAVGRSAAELTGSEDIETIAFEMFVRGQAGSHGPAAHVVHGAVAFLRSLAVATLGEVGRSTAGRGHIKTAAEDTKRSHGRRAPVESRPQPAPLGVTGARRRGRW
mmetsp:Transcript_95561/g.270341  ORF Transcript_95561/g.270341 Transcript_95561/m.270341 type:complete len:223 (+) Transcript_95561:683-1351(+)